MFSLFFIHGNRVCTQLSKIRLGTKSDLVECFEDLFTQAPEYYAAIPAVEESILDGAVIVRILVPCNLKTFNEYATYIFAKIYIHHISATIYTNG